MTTNHELNQPFPSRPPLKLAVLMSGSGRTLENIQQAIAQGQLNAVVSLVVSSNPDAYGVQRAARLGLPCVTVDRKAFADSASFSAKLWKHVAGSGAQFVCLAGFLCLIEIPPAYEHKVVNIHPALLPAFGGKGMYGKHVHKAVLDAGCKVSGCTVHMADDTYDTGPILVQRPCPVLEDDTPDTLAARVFEQECIAFPEALRLIEQGRVTFQGRIARISSGSIKPDGA